MKNAGLFFNYNYSERKINSLLKRLKKYELSKIKDNLCDDSTQREIEELAQYLSEIHKRDINVSNLKKYNAEWVVTIVENANNFQYKDEIITSLQIIEKIEHAQIASLAENRFLTREIENDVWTDNYKNGHVGSYVWDIAAILHYVSDPMFSEQFLESYIGYSNKKPSISMLYANIFYVKVVEAVICKNENSIMKTVSKILSDQLFESEIISCDTLTKLQIIGYE